MEAGMQAVPEVFGGSRGSDGNGKAAAMPVCILHKCFSSDRGKERKKRRMKDDTETNTK